MSAQLGSQSKNTSSSSSSSSSSAAAASSSAASSAFSAFSSLSSSLSSRKHRKYHTVPTLQFKQATDGSLEELRRNYKELLEIANSRYMKMEQEYQKCKQREVEYCSQIQELKLQITKQSDKIQRLTEENKRLKERAEGKEKSKPKHRKENSGSVSSLTISQSQEELPVIQIDEKEINKINTKLQSIPCSPDLDSAFGGDKIFISTLQDIDDINRWFEIIQKLPGGNRASKFMLLQLRQEEEENSARHPPKKPVVMFGRAVEYLTECETKALTALLEWIMNEQRLNQYLVPIYGVFWIPNNKYKGDWELERQESSNEKHTVRHSILSLSQPNDTDDYTSTEEKDNLPPSGRTESFIKSDLIGTYHCYLIEQYCPNPSIFYIIHYCYNIENRDKKRNGVNTQLKTILTEAEIRAIVKPILYLLVILHENLIPYDEVKTKNILLFDNGDVRLCDFRWQALENLKNNGDKISQQRAFWVAPEKIIGGNTPITYYDDKNIDNINKFQVKDSTKCKSDIWSLGIAIYEMVTGNEPFAAYPKIFDMVKKIVDTEQIELPENYYQGSIIDGHSQLSNDFRDFVKKCLIKDVNKRFSAVQLIQHSWIANNSTTLKNDKELIIGLINKYKTSWQKYLNDEKLQQEFEMRENTNVFVFNDEIA